jgi:hypothetical protein
MDMRIEKMWTYINNHGSINIQISKLLRRGAFYLRSFEIITTVKKQKESLGLTPGDNNIYLFFLLILLFLLPSSMLIY